jgi:hypothetical protein
MPIGLDWGGISARLIFGEPLALCDLVKEAGTILLTWTSQSSVTKR